MKHTQEYDDGWSVYVGDDENIHVIPKDKQHLCSEECWCQPILLEDYTGEGGSKLYNHRDLQ